MNIDKIMDKIVPTKGASLGMQRKWQGFSSITKNKLRNKLRDSDKDGVPDMFDCQPFNKNKQDTIPIVKSDTPPEDLSNGYYYNTYAKKRMRYVKDPYNNQ